MAGSPHSNPIRNHLSSPHRRAANGMPGRREKHRHDAAVAINCDLKVRSVRAERKQVAVRAADEYVGEIIGVLAACGLSRQNGGAERGEEEIKIAAPREHLEPANGLTPCAGN
ncbi:hypothetical protein K0M31_006102 [Melipona bicolor]|uniref:Uncharacterized protein n=1 Tax=Melipona bicolor TaxID=60889 RepID=A0AA40FSV4_9HYME|nr:hypothetical protein K0M31_006102 [Melipona bicolor]